MAWLAVHPNRTEDWLNRQLKDGFDIHHLDGDHFNNESSNLILIEHVDHMRLHGMKTSIGRLSPKKKKGIRRKGRRSYERAKENLAALDEKLGLIQR